MNDPRRSPDPEPSSEPPEPDPAGVEPEPLELPLDGVLDLHAFHPRDVKALVPEYLEACRDVGILEVRIIHGKGVGTLRRIVQAALDRLPWVASYRLAGEAEGGWGATRVRLKPVDPGQTRG